MGLRANYIIQDEVRLYTKNKAKKIPLHNCSGDQRRLIVSAPTPILTSLTGAYK